ncbi:DUF4157 domain-containing protein [Streptomyces cyaneochromogenes]|uniref:DUF4157 domain-containing protein n=1 Tax=Streptomyces cyaneochromogenes TaxID=2496836 RepID=A0A3Q9EYT5_9ACTN|nr:DUF4157 domain-containing protein [Streptomyces cyaneochromogenes]
MHAPDRDKNTAEAARGGLPNRRPETLDGRSPLHALQRSAGNAAVVQFLRRSGGAQGQNRHRHGVGCGHQTAQSQIQRAAVHDVLREGGRPLDDATRSDMEARLDADFSDVRIHTGGAAQASAAELGARAYTSGNHVVIGAGGADKHTLAHELTHVIQQRSGPVAGTDRGDGLRVSDPSDRFEREAEANAVRALSGSVPVSRAVQRADASPTRAGEAPQVQRMEAIKKQASAALSLFGLRRDEVAPGAPRQKAAQHIRDVLKARGLEGEDTVGSRVADAIDGIRTVAGEHGSRDIHTVFTQPELAELYAIPNSDPRSKDAHEKIAECEREYWLAQHKANPTRGTQIAIDVDVQTRVRLQRTVGGTTSYMRQFQEAFRKSMGDE